jgi:hypothetical protein
MKGTHITIEVHMTMKRKVAEDQAAPGSGLYLEDLKDTIRILANMSNGQSHTTGMGMVSAIYLGNILDSPGMKRPE